MLDKAFLESPVRSPVKTHFAPTHREPVQPLRELRASGFDAIVQVTSDAMLFAVRRNLPRERSIESRIPIDLDPTLADELADRVAAERIEAPVVSWPPPPEGEGVVVVELEPVLLRAVLSPLSVQVSGGFEPTAATRFSITLTVVAAETDASYLARVDRDSFSRLPPPFNAMPPPDSAPVNAEVPVLSTPLAVVVSGSVAAVVDEDEYRIDVDALGFAGLRHQR